MTKIEWELEKNRGDCRLHELKETPELKEWLSLHERQTTLWRIRNNGELHE